MKGYYSFQVDRIKNGNSYSNHKYRLTLTKRIISPDDLPELAEKMNKYYADLSENDYVDEQWFARQNIKHQQVFTIVCNHITSWRIINGLKYKMTRTNDNGIYNIWDFSFSRYSLEKIATNGHDFFDHESFLNFLQETLNELPKRTFSKENKQRVIESYMSSL